MSVFAFEAKLGFLNHHDRLSLAPDHESRFEFVSKLLKERQRTRGRVTFGGLTPTLNLILPGPFAPQIVRKRTHGKVSCAGVFGAKLPGRHARCLPRE